GEHGVGVGVVGDVGERRHRHREVAIRAAHATPGEVDVDAEVAHRGMEYVYLVRIYLDNAATTPALPEVCDLVVRCLREDFGNPSSSHRLARAAPAGVKRARGGPGGAPGEGQFVSPGGGTEANALATLGAARRGREASIVVSAVEHPSVMATAEKAGRVVVVPVGADG